MWCAILVKQAQSWTQIYRNANFNAHRPLFMIGERTVVKHAQGPHIWFQGEAHVKVALLGAQDAHILLVVRILNALDALVPWFSISTRSYADLLAIILLILIGIGIHVLIVLVVYTWIQHLNSARHALLSVLNVYLTLLIKWSVVAAQLDSCLKDKLADKNVTLYLIMIGLLLSAFNARQVPG